jgi:transcriptional regulatory protein GAL4
MFSINSSSTKCYNTIQNLCGEYLANGSGNISQLDPIEESPHTQINSVYSMMWPNIQLAEADAVMQDDAWLKFLGGLPPEEQPSIDDNIPEAWSLL